MAIRNLHMYESILHTMNMGLRLTLEGDVSEESLRQAYALTGKEHPCLGVIVKKEESGNVAVRADCDEMQLEVDEAEEMDVENCEAKLSEWINQPKDLTKSLFHFRYFPARANRPSHVLLICANHAYLDGPGMFHLFGSFCGYLGAIVDGQQPDEPTLREFKDIIAREKKPEGLEKPEVPDDILVRSFIPEEVDSQEVKDTVKHFYATMSPEATDALLQTCRRNGFTIQGALCAAQMLSCAKARESDHPLPQKISYLAPVDMRQRVSPPLDPADCVCGSSGIWWHQTISAEQKIVDVAHTATKEVRRLLQEGFALGFMAWFQETMWIPFATITGTTLGVVPMEEKYSAIKVKDVAFAGASYGAPNPQSNYMRHIYTFAGSLHLTMGYTWPAVGDKFVEKIGMADLRCLEVLAGAEADTMTVGSFLEMLAS